MMPCWCICNALIVHICVIPPSTACCKARALLCPLQIIRTSLAERTVPTPTVNAVLGTLFTSLSKKREFAMIVSVVSVLIRVREDKDEPGSLNAICPSGKPKPVEPEEQETKDTNLYCTFTITCSTILDNMDALDPEKKELVPKDGIILKKQKVQFKEGESVYDVLVKVCKDNNIHMESSWTPMYNSAYIEGINNLYEFDCGSLSGWMYKVNEWFPNYGCSRYVLKNGDDVVWCYTCNLGYDVGGGYATGE